MNPSLPWIFDSVTTVIKKKKNQ